MTMPTLLSPRSSSATKAPEDDGVVKKPKGVMGRIKSTFKLGRRKSSTGSASADAAAAAVAVAVNGKEAAPTEEPEAKQNNDTDHRKDDTRGECEEEEDEDAVQPYKEEDVTEVKQVTAAEMDDDLQQQRPTTPLVVAPTGVPAAPPIDDEKETNDRVATFELRAKGEPEEKEEEEEVFACDYKPGEGPQRSDATPHDDDEDDDEEDVVEVFADSSEGERPIGSSHSGNQSPPARTAKIMGAPHESDLVVVGVSPAKLHNNRGKPTVLGPSSSPIKRIQPPRNVTDAASSGNQEASGPSRADTELGLGDRIASARSTRPTRQPQAPSSSPVRRAQLLSEFQFGTESPSTTASSYSSSPLPSSPVKRRTHGSPASTLSTRRSTQHEEQQPLSINAKTSPATSSSSPAASPLATRKPDTPSAVPSVRASRPERRGSLQGITEEDRLHQHTPLSGDEPKLPPRPSAGAGRRLRAASTEAPILVSSFAAADDHESPISSSEPNAVGTEDEEASHADESAFAFDAGAAITHEYGERVARLLGADPWGDRQDGLDAILYQLKKTDLANAANRRELFCAAIAAVQCGVDDRVAPVMYCALECLRGVLKEFAAVLDRSFLKYALLNEQLSGLTRAIVGKLGDSNKRTQREASQAVVRLAKLKKLRVLPHVLLHLSAKEVAPRQRVETLRLLIKELGVDNQTALNVEVAMQFAVPVLKLADDKTRKAAVELIAELHLINGQAVSAQLTTGVKPEMLRVIKRRIDELVVQREQERQQQSQQTQAAQNANQAEEDATHAMVLVALPAEDDATTRALLETMQQQAQSVVGPVVWRKLESKTWSDRKEALVDVEKTITDAKSDLRDVKPAFHSVVQHNFVAYCTVVYRCLSDAIAPVVNSAMDAFSTLVKVYGPCVEWREDAVRDVILLTIMRLFGTMQKPNNRTNRAACRCILKLTRLTNPHTLRYAVSCVSAKETDALVQMHLLRLLVPEFGFQSDGISAHHVLELVAPALAHSSDKVRKTATDVALCTQRLMGKDLVLKKLQDAAVKPTTLKELERHFVDVEVQKDGERPQTVHATAVPSSSTLPPVQFGGDQARRLLHSAPVGLGKLHCTPPHEHERESRAAVLSHDEESLMDSILGGDDF